MKKALVYIQDHDGRSIGDIERIGSAQDIDNYRGFLLSNGICIKVVVPDEVTNGCEKSVLVAEQAEYWSKEGEANSATQPVFAVDTWIKDGQPDETVDPVDETYTAYLADDADPRWTYNPVVPEHWEIQEDVTKKKVIDIGTKYITMRDEVYDDLGTVFGTKNSDTSTAVYLTAMAMKDDPTFFDGQGCVAEITTASFTKGDALDTLQKITDYSTEAIAVIKQYGVDRNLKVKQFLIDKAAIESS